MRAHAVLFEFHPAADAVIAVAGKAIKFMHQNQVEPTLCRVGQHLLKLRPVGCSRRLRPVDILMDDQDIVVARRSHALL